MSKNRTADWAGGAGWNLGRRSRLVGVLALGVLALSVLAACFSAVPPTLPSPPATAAPAISSPTETLSPTTVPATPVPETAKPATREPATAVPPTPLPSTATPIPAAPTPVRITLGEGSAARYIIGEQLARRNLPNDAIGETSEIRGTIHLDANGKVDPSSSAITVNLQSLKSDRDRRDRFLRGNGLESDKFPTAEVAVLELPGLPWPLPGSGGASFQMVSDLTVHGETRPVTWDVKAVFGPEKISGTARATVTFDQFNMDKPSLAFILSVNDEIDLELDFEAVLER